MANFIRIQICGWGNRYFISRIGIPGLNLRHSLSLSLVWWKNSGGKVIELVRVYKGIRQTQKAIWSGIRQLFGIISPTNFPYLSGLTLAPPATGFVQVIEKARVVSREKQLRSSSSCAGQASSSSSSSSPHLGSVSRRRGKDTRIRTSRA